MSTRTLRRVGLLAGTSLLALAAVGPAASPVLAKPGSGAIWTTNETCQSPAIQNDNLYAAGEAVVIRGEGFEVDAPFDWTITGQPGGASGDPRIVVASGSGTTDADGTFCVEAYTVAVDDWGTYTVDVEQGRARKNDNYLATGGSADEPTDDPGDQPADEPADEPTDDPGDQPADEPADEPTDDPAEDPVDEPPADEPADELPTDEPPADEPPTDEPPADETPVDEPPAHETPVDEPLADEPPTDEQSTQEILSLVSGPAIVPPDTSVAPTTAPTAPAPWSLLLAALGLVTLAVALAAPARARRAPR